MFAGHDPKLNDQETLAFSAAVYVHRARPVRAQRTSRNAIGDRFLGLLEFFFQYVWRHTKQFRTSSKTFRERVLVHTY